MSTIDPSVFEAAMAELRRRSQLTIYQTDFDAWAWDVLRLRNYEKMRAIAWDMLFADTERTLVKSGNGVGKSALVSQLILWAGSVWPEGDTVSIISAPSIPQLQKVTFKYLKEYHGRVSETLSPRDFRVPGRIDENLGWVSETSNGKIWLATGRKPPDQDAVSMFQGLRSPNGMTYVWFDEAGGMSRAMFTAAEAVQTGEDSRFGGIGNPDNAGTEFQQSFIDKEKSREFNLHTISVFDTPVFTGERVYPDTPEGDLMEERLRRALTSKRWVAHKTRIWATGGEIVPYPDHPEDRRYDRRVDKLVTEELDPADPKPEHLGREVIEIEGVKHVVMERSEVKWDARGLSKVLGEFPGDADFAFFPQAVITLAHDTEFPDDLSVKPVLGVDIARFGADESVIYVNRGGRARLLDSWGRTDTVESARKIHEHAQAIGAAEVRIDATGVGGGVYDMLTQLDEFSNKVYIVIGVDGAKRSPDPRRWANSRAYNHDQLRTLMATGAIDLDYEDRELADQLVNVTFRFSKVQGAIQITPKDEMRTEMDGSPDRLDALIYSAIDTSSLFVPEGAIQPGDIVLMDPWEMLAASRMDEDYPL
jgi:hypothetical protein